MCPPEEYASRRARLTARLDELIAADWDDKDANRRIKRPRRHRDDRGIRPAVRFRKNRLGNRSGRGADTQAVLMSVYRKLQRRGHAPPKTAVDALTASLKTGKPPPLPAKVAADG